LAALRIASSQVIELPFRVSPNSRTRIAARNYLIGNAFPTYANRPNETTRDVAAVFLTCFAAIPFAQLEMHLPSAI
jgi:hypothetical protein